MQINSANTNPLTKRMNGTTGFTLLELMVTMSIIVLLSTLIIIAIDPLNLILSARDGNRVNAVDTINKALQSYIIAPNNNMSCNNFGACPTDFSLDGSDAISTALVQNHFLKNIPEPPDNPLSDDLCDYHLFLYKNSDGEDDYMLRWCFESWTEEDVNKVSGPNYLCTWNDTENIATCITNRTYKIPPVKI